MTSRSAPLTFFSLLVCLTNIVSGQTNLNQTLMVSPSVAYPQAQPAGGWYAGSPNGFVVMPQGLAQELAAHNLLNPMTASYVPMVALSLPANMGNYAMPRQNLQPYAMPNVSAPMVVGYTPMVTTPLPANVGHQASAAAARSYWTEMTPEAGTLAPTFPRQPAVQHRLNYLESVRQYEGSVLGQHSLLVNRQVPLVSEGDPTMVTGPFQRIPQNYFQHFDGSAGPKLQGSWLEYGHDKASIGCGGRCCSSRWSVGFDGLLMSRDNENNYRFSYDGADETIQLTNARDANFDWARGFEVSVARRFNCGRNSLEAVYWRLFPHVGTTTTTDADTVGALNGILNWDQLDYGLDPFLLPWTGDDFTNDSTVHMVQRENRIQNFEINLLTYLGGEYTCGHGICGGCAAGCGSRWSHDWLFGVRIFEFRDHLLFGAERAGGNYDFLFEDDEIYYNIDVTNDLIGVQLGSSGAYAVSCRCSLDYNLKFGMYVNHISHTSEIGGSQGIATINNGPNLGVDFFVQNTKNDFAFLGEAKLGVSWQLSNCWSAKIGYRAIAVTGVALPTNQIYPDLRGIQDVREVDSNGSLILHGGYGRIEYQF